MAAIGSHDCSLAATGVAAVQSTGVAASQVAAGEELLAGRYRPAEATGNKLMSIPPLNNQDIFIDKQPYEAGCYF